MNSLTGGQSLTSLSLNQLMTGLHEARFSSSVLAFCMIPEWLGLISGRTYSTVVEAQVSPVTAPPFPASVRRRACSPSAAPRVSTQSTRPTYPPPVFFHQRFHCVELDDGNGLWVRQ